MNGIIRELKITSLKDNSNELQVFDDLLIQGKISIEKEIVSPSIGIVIRNIQNVAVVGINNAHYGIKFDSIKNNQFAITLFSLPLMPGRYQLDIYIGDGLIDYYVLEGIAEFEISDRLIRGMSKNPETRINSFVLSKTDWKVN